MKVIGIIPARFNSTRFPGKPLINIKGKTMIERVYKGALKANHLDDLIIATDDKRIYDHARDFGAKVVMTDTNLPSGTDRVWAAYSHLKLNYDLILNIQGDEPLIDASHIDAVIEIFEKRKNAQIGTLAKIIDNKDEVSDPNKVKVVFNKDNKALYFSRSPIPFLKNNSKDISYYKHIGIYGYKVSTLNKIASLNHSTLELTEELEQLRWLDNDLNIHLEITNTETPSVDCPEDLENLLLHYESRL